ncbi:MAG TPA: hypothetical protein VFV11_08390 [Solimonas sp.]|nr:hypothetical protein [Solimonas sp.]
MKSKQGADATRLPARAVHPAGERAGAGNCFNILVLAGGAVALDALHKLLTQAPALPWRTAEEVEREVVHLAVWRSGRRIEALSLEDVMSACEEVEARHLIDNGAISRHFRNLWQTSSAYCRQYMRGVLADRPGSHAKCMAADLAAHAAATPEFSLARLALPPFRVLQGSYRYAGRTWCQRHWGTPEDAHLVSYLSEAQSAHHRIDVYEFETVDRPPNGVLARLHDRYRSLALSSVSIDGDTGKRSRLIGGCGHPMEQRELPAASLIKGRLTAVSYRESLQLAREAALSLFETPGKSRPRSH